MLLSNKTDSCATKFKGALNDPGIIARSKNKNSAWNELSISIEDGDLEQSGISGIWFLKARKADRHSSDTIVSYRIYDTLIDTTKEVITIWK
jgi:hypothetical protein